MSLSASAGPADSSVVPGMTPLVIGVAPGDGSYRTYKTYRGLRGALRKLAVFLAGIHVPLRPIRRQHVASPVSWPGLKLTRNGGQFKHERPA